MHETVAALAFVVRDVTETLSTPHRGGDVLQGYAAEIVARGLEHVTEESLHVRHDRSLRGCWFRWPGAIDERVDLARDSIPQFLRLVVGDLLVAESLGDVLVGRRCEGCHETSLALVRRGVGDLANARAGQLRGEVLRREAEVLRGLTEEVAHNFRCAYRLRRCVVRRGEDRVFLLRGDDALLNETVEDLLELVAGLVRAEDGRGGWRDGGNQAGRGLGTERAEGCRSKEAHASDAQCGRQHQFLSHGLHFVRLLGMSSPYVPPV